MSPTNPNNSNNKNNASAPARSNNKKEKWKRGSRWYPKSGGQRPQGQHNQTTSGSQDNKWASNTVDTATSGPHQEQQPSSDSPHKPKATNSTSPAKQQRPVQVDRPPWRNNESLESKRSWRNFSASFEAMNIRIHPSNKSTPSKDSSFEKQNGLRNDMRAKASSSEAPQQQRPQHKAWTGPSQENPSEQLPIKSLADARFAEELLSVAQRETTRDGRPEGSKKGKGLADSMWATSSTAAAPGLQKSLVDGSKGSSSRLGKNLDAPTNFFQTSLFPRDMKIKTHPDSANPADGNEELFPDYSEQSPTNRFSTAGTIPNWVPSPILRQSQRIRRQQAQEARRRQDRQALIPQVLCNLDEGRHPLATISVPRDEEHNSSARELPFRHCNPGTTPDRDPPTTSREAVGPRAHVLVDRHPVPTTTSPTHEMGNDQKSVAFRSEAEPAAAVASSSAIAPKNSSDQPLRHSTVLAGPLADAIAKTRFGVTSRGVEYRRRIQNPVPNVPADDLYTIMTEADFHPANYPWMAAHFNFPGDDRPYPLAAGNMSVVERLSSVDTLVKELPGFVETVGHTYETAVRRSRELAKIPHLVNDHEGRETWYSAYSDKFDAMRAFIKEYNKWMRTVMDAVAHMILVRFPQASAPPSQYSDGDTTAPKKQKSKGRRSMHMPNSTIDGPAQQPQEPQGQPRHGREYVTEFEELLRQGRPEEKGVRVAIWPALQNILWGPNPLHLYTLARARTFQKDLDDWDNKLEL
ncbi:hypothetical protein MKZ38_006995 [Zalerion maritima]|uniref:Uncharacterized protein n=1 Tax=Zalerion maritima TaxID=339359 RepID=A0AAD5RII5_9PEZI|nr:hypothetical protein MKZ38_006995 [Zalerion maritima]